MFCITRKVLRVREFRGGFFPLLFSSFSALAASLFLLCGCATRIHAQEFGGCHCVPLHPKPIAQLDQERNALINEINRNHATRKELIRQFKEHSLRQEEIWKEILILNKDYLDFESEIFQLKQLKTQIYADSEQLRFQWIENLSVVNRDEFVKDRLSLLDVELADDPGFADGYLYRSLLQMQSGDKMTARTDIRAARELMYGSTTTLNEKFHTEFKPAQIVDMVYASLLLGDDKPAWNYVKICEQRFPAFINHPVYLHMQAKYEECENSYSKASELYKKAIQTIEGSSFGNESYHIEELYADAAWFFAAVPVHSRRNPTLAMRYAELSLKNSNCKSWLGWRAISAIKASKKDWEIALLALEYCQSHAPQILHAELAEQLIAYKNKKPFWMKRRINSD